MRCAQNTLWFEWVETHKCGSNIRRVGITPECKEHLSKAKQPRLLEISIGVRSLSLSEVFSF